LRFYAGFSYLTQYNELKGGKAIAIGGQVWVWHWFLPGLLISASLRHAPIQNQFSYILKDNRQ
jgi:hypothetical protein